jgi:hypothetical protein
MVLDKTSLLFIKSTQTLTLSPMALIKMRLKACLELSPKLNSLPNQVLNAENFAVQVIL